MSDIIYLSALHFSCIVQDLSLWYIGSAVTALKFSCPTACGSLVPQPGIKPESPLLEDRFQPLDTREVPEIIILYCLTTGQDVEYSIRWVCSFYISVQLSSVAQSCPTLCDRWTAAHQTSLSITSSQSLLKLMSIESVMPSNHLILCRPLLLPP